MTKDAASYLIRQATADDTDTIFNLVQTTIRAVYPSYYEPAIVEDFVRYHARDIVAADIKLGKVHLLEEDGRAVATGSVDGSYITRVYVLPKLRGKGYGSAIMDWLEGLLAKDYDAATIDSSVPAEEFYLRRGYHVVKHDAVEVKATDGLPAAILAFKVMEKQLRS